MTPVEVLERVVASGLLLVDPLDRDDARRRLDEFCDQLEQAREFLASQPREFGDPLSVACTPCGAPVGGPCSRYDGSPRAPHAERELNALGEAVDRGNPKVLIGNDLWGEGAENARRPNPKTQARGGRIA